MLFLLSLYLILKVCQSQSLCLFQISLASVDMLICSFHFLCLNGNLSSVSFFFFLIPLVLKIVAKAHTALTQLWEMQLFCVCCTTCSSTGLIMRSLKALTPPCQKLDKSHAAMRGKRCLFLILLRLGNTT